MDGYLELDLIEGFDRIKLSSKEVLCANTHTHTHTQTKVKIKVLRDLFI